MVTFDWSTGTMYLDPLAEDGGIPPFSDEPAGASINWTDGGLVVGGIPQGSSAGEAGLTVGEVITSVDGESVEGLTIDQYCSDITGQKHESITTDSGTYDVGPVEGFFDSLQR